MNPIIQLLNFHTLCWLLFAIMDTYLIHAQLYVSNTKINYSVKPQ